MSDPLLHSQVIEQFNQELGSFASVLDEVYKNNKSTFKFTLRAQVTSPEVRLRLINAKNSKDNLNKAKFFLKNTHWHEILKPFNLMPTPESIQNAQEILESDDHRAPIIIFKMESDEAYKAFIESRLAQAEALYKLKNPTTQEPTSPQINSTDNFAEFSVRVSNGSTFDYLYDVDLFTNKLTVHQNITLGELESPITLDLKRADLMNFNRFLPANAQSALGYDLISECLRPGSKKGVYIKTKRSSNIKSLKKNITISTHVHLDVAMGGQIFSIDRSITDLPESNTIIQNPSALHELMLVGATSKKIQANASTFLAGGVEVLDVKVVNFNAHAYLTNLNKFKCIYMIAQHKVNEEPLLYIFTRNKGVYCFDMKGDQVKADGAIETFNEKAFEQDPITALLYLISKMKTVHHTYFSIVDKIPANPFVEA